MPTPARIATLAAVLLAFATRAASAQTGSVHGHVFATSDRAPVAYALVRLAPETPGAPVRTVLSDEAGAFTFAAVAPGTYRLRLERIGFTAEQSDAFTVADGQTVERDFRSVPTAIALRGIVATPGCRTAGNLQQDPALAALWNEAVKGVETRRAFDAAYHYEVDLTQLTTKIARGKTESFDSTTVHAVMDPRRRTDRARQGWGHVNARTMDLEIPDGLELLDTAFLRTHCIDGGRDEESGAWTIGFRPVSSRGRRVDVQGELKLDTATLQVRSIEVEWWQGRRRLLQATVHFTDAHVPGGIVRMPIGADFSGHPPRSMRIDEVRGQVLFLNYGNLVKVEGTSSP